MGRLCSRTWLLLATFSTYLTHPSICRKGISERIRNVFVKDQQSQPSRILCTVSGLLRLRGGDALDDKITAMENEMRRTQKNKATESHLGHLRSRLSTMRKLRGKDTSLASTVPLMQDLNLVQTRQPESCLSTDAHPSNADVLSQYSVSDSGKARLSLLDLIVEARLLKKSLVGMRLSNIYDFDAKTFIFKLGGGSSWSADAATDPDSIRCQESPQDVEPFGMPLGTASNGEGPGGASNSSRMGLKWQFEDNPEECGKEGGVHLAADALQVPGQSRQVLLVVESGVRIHTTKYTHPTPPEPCGFVVKLRKHLRAQRLTDVRLVGGDRLLCLTFGAGNWTHHLLVEFYAGGNMVLCDTDFRILSLLRPYTGADGQRVAVKHRYPLVQEPGEASVSVVCMDASRLIDCLRRVQLKCAAELPQAAGIVPTSLGRNTTNISTSVHAASGRVGKSGSRPPARREAKPTLFRMLAAEAAYAPPLVLHALLQAGWHAEAHLSAHNAHAALARKLDVACGAGECEASAHGGCVAALARAWGEIDTLLGRRPAVAGQKETGKDGGGRGSRRDDDDDGGCLERGEGPASSDEASSDATKGYILVKASQGAGGRREMVEVTPLVLAQQTELAVVEYASLDEALDDYFSARDKAKGVAAASARDAGASKVAACLFGRPASATPTTHEKLLAVACG